MAKTEHKQEDYNQKTVLTNIEVQEVNVEDVFGIVKNGNSYLIAVTNQIVSKKTFASVEEARSYIQSKPWELILNTCAVMMQRLTELNNSKK